MNVPDGGHESRGGEKANPLNRHQFFHDRSLSGHGAKLSFDIGHAALNGSDLSEDLDDGGSKYLRDRRIGVFEQSPDSREDLLRPLGQGDAELTKDAPDGVDPGGPCGHPG